MTTLAPIGAVYTETVAILDDQEQSAAIADSVDLPFGATIGIGGFGTEFGGFSEEQAGVAFENSDLYFVFLKYYV